MEKNKKGGFFTRRNIILGILALVVVLSGICVIREQLEARRQREEQERLAALAEQTTEAPTQEIEIETETEAPYVSPIDFEALWKENPDTVGWITVPGTQIDYPIVYDGEDNETYLHKDFNGNDSVYGTIYLDADSEPDFSGWNNPIYGHHMRDGSMFKDVTKFKDEAFFKEHQYFEIYTPERTIHLKALSCYYADASGIVRKTRFTSQESFDEWVKERLEPCEFAEIPEFSVDNMYVLVTCSYEFNNARTLLFAVEVDEDEDHNIIPADEEKVNARIEKLIEEKKAELAAQEASSEDETAESGK